jgi:plastocyanin
MVDDCFEATVLRVQPGSEVSWTNRDAVEHTVTGVGGTWGSLDVRRRTFRVA